MNLQIKLASYLMKFQSLACSWFCTTSIFSSDMVLMRVHKYVALGADAPTRSNLRTWLKENPTYEVIGANNINTLQIGGKIVTQIQTSGKPVRITRYHIMSKSFRMFRLEKYNHT